MWDVLEHVPSPKKTLSLCHKLLKPGGLVVFSIPNLNSYDRHLFGEKWIGWDPPRHFHLFDEGTISRLLDETNFIEIDKDCIIGGKGTFLLSIDNLIRASWIEKSVHFTYPLLSAIMWPYRKFAYYLKRGPIITYAIQKS